MATCKGCDSLELVSAVELESGICAVCIPKIVANYEILVLSKDRLSSENEELKSTLEQSNSAITDYLDAMRANEDGRQAAMRGLNDNPHEGDLAEHWNAGWQDGEAIRRMRTLEMLLARVMGDVSLAQQSTVTAGNTEATARLEAIREIVAMEILTKEDLDG